MVLLDLVPSLDCIAISFSRYIFEIMLKGGIELERRTDDGLKVSTVLLGTDKRALNYIIGMDDESALFL